jgi:hypothetical protein
MKYKIAPEYSAEFLETERPQPLTDRKIEQLQQEVLSGNISKDISDQVFTDFKRECTEWIMRSKLNRLEGLSWFERCDIITGCTQAIDTQYMKGPVQIIKGDYRYHERLNPKIEYIQRGGMQPNIPLIAAQPFPSTGDTFPDFFNFVEEAFYKNVPLHIDMAWLTCCKDIRMNVMQVQIKTAFVSLSKGLGLGWNRIGLRWTKDSEPDAITIMNDFNMVNKVPVMIGLHFIRNLPPDHLWTSHGHRYEKICRDFNLTPTKSIYLAMRDGHPVGVSPLIRYLEESNL